MSDIIREAKKKETPMDKACVEKRGNDSSIDSMRCG